MPPRPRRKVDMLAQIAMDDSMDSFYSFYYGIPLLWKVIVGVLSCISRQVWSKPPCWPCA